MTITQMLCGMILLLSIGATLLSSEVSRLQTQLEACVALSPAEH